MNMDTILLEHFGMLYAGYWLVFLAAVSICLRWMRGAAKPLTARLLLAMFSVMAVLLCLEGYLGLAGIQSDGFNFTLSGRRWLARYWKPLNAQGYRDLEHRWADRVLFVVGDSFAAGHGITKIEDRFADQLRPKLGKDWTVAVLAQNGWNIREYFRAVEGHPVSPEHVVVSWYINDIADAAASGNARFPQMDVRPPRLLAFFVDRSYLFNRLFYRLYRNRFEMREYGDLLKRAHADPEIRDLHRRELLMLIGAIRKRGSSVSFILWPGLTDLDGFCGFTAEMADFLEDRGIPVLDMGAHLAGVPGPLTVNALDAHPRPEVHALAADLLYEYLAGIPDAPRP